ncbi:MAG: oligosaccharide flippase family protein, partial [Bacteroidota bacterium]|nr:oligosaccharide flippase family protein [Bacteroidota bacterium]
MKHLKNLVGQTLLYGLGTIVPRVLNFLILTPFFTRTFSKAEYGVFSELYAYVVFLLVLLIYGMETAFFRFTESENDYRKVFSTSIISLFVTSSVFLILTNIFSSELASLIGYEHNSQYISWFCIIVAIDAFMAIPFAKLRFLNKATKFGIIKIFNVLINIGLILFFYKLLPIIINNNPNSAFSVFYNPNMGIGYAFIANLIASVFTFVVLIPEIFNVKLNFDFSLLKRMLKYAFPLLIVGLAGMINEVIDKILLKYLVTDAGNPMEQVGIYSANYKLAVLMTLFIQMFRYAAEPFFFSRMKDKNAKVLYADVMKYFIVFGLLIFLGVTLYIDIFKHYIGSNFHSGLRIVPIVLLANLFLGIIYNLSIWYKLNNKTKYGAYIAIFGALVTLGLNFLLVPKIG